MPRRNSLTRRFLHHLLLLSLARCILTVLGRGRAWDEWDDRGGRAAARIEAQLQRRFVHAMSFCPLFFAGLALSAGAGNGVRSMLAADETTPVAAQAETGSTGADRPAGPTGQAGRAVRGRSGRPTQAAPARPTRSRPARRLRQAAVLTSRPAGVAVTAAAAPKKAAVSTTHVARPARSAPGRTPTASTRHRSLRRPRARSRGERRRGGDRLAEPLRSRPDASRRPAPARVRA